MPYFKNHINTQPIKAPNLSSLPQQRQKRTQLLMLSTEAQEDQRFLNNQVRCLNFLKKIAETLHHKKITDHCFIEEEAEEL